MAPPEMDGGRTKRPRLSKMRTARKTTLLFSVVGVVALAAFVLLSSQAGGTCGAFLGFRQQKDVRLDCQAVSNGLEFASYRCPVPQEHLVDYSGASALFTGPEGGVLGKWGAPITFNEEGRVTPTDSWGPLDTSAALVDDGDGRFGPGDVFHIDAVQNFRFGGATFVLAGDCWSAAVVLD
ncbi:MAG TPA: hypothetical protein VI893_02400 [Thermoplasmata archaeon]|nr:hypothetical protein [Thermoplasmata archaeon]